MKPFLACGCVANATSGGRPSCAIHLTTQVVEAPNLEGRTARCSCGRTRASSPDLEFFEYRGPGSPSATESCRCGFYKVAHEYDETRVSKQPIKCRVGGFSPRGDIGTDLYYCGHGGWD